MSDPYLSHPVRRMRDDPIADEPVTLVVTATTDDAVALAALSERLEAAGATVTDRLRFGALRVATTEDTVAAIVALDGIESVETGAVTEMGGDAGEDVGFEDG
jgi:hypothetical protein